MKDDGVRLSEVQRSALAFMSSCMWTEAYAVGLAASVLAKRGGGNFKSVGAGVLGSLGRRGFVSQIGEGGGRGLWRITPAGRAALSRAEAPERKGSGE